MFEHYFTGNKPSKASIMKVIKQAIKDDYRKMEISWGENMITLEKFNNKWFGAGWIKTIGGQDIANELQSTKIY